MSSGNASSDLMEYPHFAVSMEVVYIATAVLGLSLNLSTMLIVGLGQNFSKEIRIQLINKAIVDFFVAATFPAFTLTAFLGRPFPENASLCKFVRFFGQTVLHASPLCNAAISVERLVVVFFPFRAAQYNIVRNGVIVLIIWICAALPEVEMLTNSYIDDSFGVTACEHNAPLAVSNPLLYEWSVTLKYLIPLALMVACYTAIFAKLCLSKQQSTRSVTSKNWKEKVERVQLMLVADALLTIMTILPYQLYYPIREEFYGDDEKDFSTEEHFYIKNIMAAIMATNAFSTPLVYLAFSKEFWRDTKSLFRRINRAKATNTPDATSDLYEVSERTIDIPNKPSEEL